jgi:glycosyltransferase involved in cell wall biosynthesis
MKKQKFVLVNALPLDIVSGGNVYNQNLCAAFENKGIEMDYFYTKEIEKTILGLDEESIILVDSFCLNEKVNWINLLNRKIILLLHLAPSADDQKNTEKRNEIIEVEKFVFKNFPIITAGKKAIEYIESNYNFHVNSYQIVPPAISSSWIKKANYNLLPKKLLVIGTITERKGYKRLIETLSLLKETDWICDCYGSISDTTLMQEITRLIKENGLENRIQFLGTIDNSKMNLLQTTYDLLAQLSDEENNSVALMEAIASGLPFISTPTGNHHHYKENKCGFITSGFESETIAKELKSILEVPKNYELLVQSLSTIAPNTWDKNIDSILNFTNKLWN